MLEKNLIHKAIMFAAQKHEGQKRKIDGTPCIAHIMETMQILTAAQCDENIIAAGILHDTLEDTKTTAQEIETQFGKEVLSIVQSVTDDKSKSWWNRAHQTIDNLPFAPLATRLVRCADKLSNIRSICFGLEKHGDKIWEIFDKEKTKWYYTHLLDALKSLKFYDMFCELELLVGAITGAKVFSPFSYEPLPPERIEQIIKSLKQLWQSDNYKEMRFFQLVEVLGNEYKNENNGCDLWNLHDETFASWLSQKLQTILSRKGGGKQQ